MAPGLDPGCGRGRPRTRWTVAVAAAALLPALLPVPLPGQERDDPAGAASDAPGSSFRPLRVLDVPYLPQSEALCGGAAAAMIMRYWGDGRARPEHFAALVRPEEGGIRAGELAEEIRRQGWRAARVGGDLDAVRAHLSEGRPVILLIRVGPDRHHYVTAVASREGEWLVHDPARSPYRRYAEEELLDRWEGSDRWGLVVVPGTAEGAGEPGRPADAPARRPADGADGAPSGEDGRCADGVAAGIRAARDGRTARADSLLRRAARACPGDPGPRRELAGLRFRQERWGASISLAKDALAVAPGDAHALRILAAARFMAGDGEGALAVWNRLGEPRLTGLRVYGLRRTRYRPLRRQIDLPAGRVLSEAGLRAARRRVAGMPAFAASRVGYRSPAAGRTELEVAAVERALLPSSPAALAGLAARAAAERELRVRIASPTGGGELWTAGWSWWEERPRVALGVAAPGAFGLPGVWEVHGLWRRAAFRTGPAGASAGADGGAPSAASVIREERRRGALSASRWVSGSVRLGATASLERWGRAGRRAGLGLEARIREEGTAFRATARGWAGPGPEFWRAGLEARGRWAGPGSSRLRVGAGLEAVGAETPRMLWPGAGAGHVRRPLLRAHPLLRDGVVAGPAFGRTLAHAGWEFDLELPLSLPVSVRAAGFLDLARAWRGDAAAGRAPPDAGGRLLADLGAGLRLGLPGAGGRLRLDAATGLADGAEALSVGWEAPWPGW